MKLTEESAKQVRKLITQLRKVPRAWDATSSRDHDRGFRDGVKACIEILGAACGGEAIETIIDSIG